MFLDVQSKGLKKVIKIISYSIRLLARNRNTYLPIASDMRQRCAKSHRRLAEV